MRRSPATTNNQTCQVGHLFTDQDIMLNQDGTVNRNSKAVKSGAICFKGDGSIDRRCSAHRNGNIILDSNDQIDSAAMGLSKRVNPEEISTEVIRSPYEQQKYRNESRSTQKDRKQACHIIDLEVARAILATKSGPHLTEEQLHKDMKPLNTLLRMRSTETNQTTDKYMAQQIIQLYKGERKEPITRALSNKITQMHEALKSIQKDQLNSSLLYLKNEMVNLHQQCQV